MSKGLFRFLNLGAVFFSFVIVAPAMAAGTDDVQRITLHVDEGFLGHPVTFDVFDGRVRLAWEAGDVLQPSDVTLEMTSSSEVTMTWSSSYVLGPNGVLLGLQSPSSTWDAPILEAKAPFEAWHQIPMQTSGGYILSRVGAEVTERIATQPIGMRQGTASWYKYKGCRCAASPDFPKGSKLLVRRLDDPTKATVITVNDFGPDRSLFPTRVIDLDSVAFKELSPLSAGMLRVSVEPLDPADVRAAYATAPLTATQKIQAELANAPH